MLPLFGSGPEDTYLSIPLQRDEGPEQSGPSSLCGRKSSARQPPAQPPTTTSSLPATRSAAGRPSTYPAAHP